HWRCQQHERWRPFHPFRQLVRIRRRVLCSSCCIPPVLASLTLVRTQNRTTDFTKQRTMRAAKCATSVHSFPDVEDLADFTPRRGIGIRIEAADTQCNDCCKE